MRAALLSRSSTHSPDGVRYGTGLGGHIFDASVNAADRIQAAGQHRNRKDLKGTMWDRRHRPSLTGR